MGAKRLEKLPYNCKTGYRILEILFIHYFIYLKFCLLMFCTDNPRKAIKSHYVNNSCLRQLIGAIFHFFPPGKRRQCGGVGSKQDSWNSHVRTPKMERRNRDHLSLQDQGSGRNGIALNFSNTKLRILRTLKLFFQYSQLRRASRASAARSGSKGTL